jgi:hypothetical protein
MTVEDLRKNMTQAEFLGWQIFHGRKAQRQQLEMLKAGR